MSEKSFINDPQFISPKIDFLNSGIDPNAIKIIEKLLASGFSAYLVGGCIRDILLQKKPKDFDIVTNAKPEQIKGIFNNCLLIGRRFRLAHLRFGRHIIEVATFRSTIDPKSKYQQYSTTGMIIKDNVYGNIHDDVWRRDFTINALYYDLKQKHIIDYVNGTKDINTNTLRLIGNPKKRYHEDPVRMLRAIRFSCKLNLTLEKETLIPIKQHAPLLKNIAPARLFEEFMKLFFFGAAEKTFNSLQKNNLFPHLFPQTHVLIAKHKKKYLSLLEIALRNTDQRISAKKHINPAFLLATFLWPSYQERLKKLNPRQKCNKETRQEIIEQILKIQRKSLSVPKKFSAVIEQIWDMQPHLQYPTKTLAPQVLQHPKFRAAYDFLLLRAESGESNLEQMASWWTELQEVEYAHQDYLFSQLPIERNAHA